LRRATLASALALVLCAALLGSANAGAQPKPTVVAPTPYMGWDTYFAIANGFNEASILQQASLLKSTGLEAAGYRLVWLDAGWWQGQRDAQGNVAPSPTQWPHGIAWLASTLHRNGFKLGVYTDGGPTGCGTKGGSYGHYQPDMNTFASWGVDAVKADWCGGVANSLDPATQYTQLHQAILNNSSHRPMILNVCNYLQPFQKASGVPAFNQSVFSSYAFGSQVATSWRTDTDVGSPGNVPFNSVLRNMDADATSPLAAGPGHWNDPDYLGPDQGMTAVQFQTQFSMWAMLAAPLMVSDNLLTMTKASLATVSNKAVIAIDQDPAGVQGTLVSWAGNGEIWKKPLINRNYAVALLNRGTTSMQISTTAAMLGLPAARSYDVTNLWTTQKSTSTGSFGAQVAGDATVLLRISPAAS
jgi:alpha-galactosidase